MFALARILRTVAASRLSLTGPAEPQPAYAACERGYPGLPLGSARE